MLRETFAYILGRVGRCTSCGQSRSASLVCAYLMRARRVSAVDAYTYLKKCRSMVRPNPGFFKQLLAFEQTVLGKPATFTLDQYAAIK